MIINAPHIAPDVSVDERGGNIRSGQDIAVLDAFRRDPDVVLVIWQRRLPRCLEAWLSKLVPDSLPRGRVLVEPRHARAAIRRILKDSGTPMGGAHDLFVNDVVTLTEKFSNIIGAAEVDIRLEAITNNACWKFHRDCVSGRLITTYCGSTTQWVAPVDAEGALKQQASFSGRLNILPPHAVGLFRGNCEGPGRGVVHRSPPISGTGETRLFLALNPPTAASPHSYFTQ